MSHQVPIVEAEAFVVRDSQGRMRGFFGMEGEEPVLKVCDPEGQARIVLRLTTETSGGALSDNAEGSDIGLSLTAGSEGIALFGRDGKPHLTILGMPNGTSFYVYDSSNRVRLRIDVRDGGSAFSVHDQSGHVRGLFEHRNNEGSGLFLLDKSGKVSTSIDSKGSPE